jgi:LacI family transcriptional regulator
MNKVKKIDIYLIAKEARVSIATISRYFNNKSLVSSKTREKIHDVCEKYKYEPLSVASALNTKRTKSIALSIPSLRQPAFIDLITAIENVATSKGYSLLLYNTKEDIHKELDFLNVINKRTIDGIIVSGVYGFEEDKLFIDEIQKRNIACIMVDRYILGSEVPSVISNDYLGGRLASQYLLNNNHKKIGIISFNKEVSILCERIKGFTDFLQSKKLKEYFIEQVPLKVDQLEESLLKHLNLVLASKVTAIFCMADFIAVGLINLLTSRGIRIPQDISIVGYDNILFSKYTIPRLTTIDHKIFEMGQFAANNLINKLERGNYIKIKKIFNPVLIERDSVHKI